MNFKKIAFTVIALMAAMQIYAQEKQFASKSRWIWFDAPSITVGKCYYRTTLEFKDAESVILVTYMDDIGDFYLNGNKLVPVITGRGPNNSALVKARQFDLTGKLKQGKNVLAVCVNNMKHSGGFIMLGTVIQASGKAEYLHSDKNWKACGTFAENWMNENFDDSKWANAREFMDVYAKPWADVSEILNICRTAEEKAAAEK